MKDPLFAIECWNYFCQTNPESDVKFKIIGPIIDADYGRGVLEQVAKSKRIVYVPFVAHRELLEQLASSYLTLNSSTSEGQSAAMLESMAAGVPVLARDIPGNNFILDGTNGFKFSTRDDFSRQLQTLLRDEFLRNKIAENAYSHVEKYHSVENEKQLYLNVFNKYI